MTSPTATPATSDSSTLYFGPWYRRSDAGLWARGLAVNSGMDVKVREPEVYPLQVHGPKSSMPVRLARSRTR